MPPFGVKRCCCQYTLWKIDPSDGSIVWKSDRGADSSRIDVYNDGSNVIIYETGEFGSKHETLSKWRDDGSSRTHLWDYTPQNSDTDEGYAVRRSADDDVIWLLSSNSTNMALDRITNSTGANINDGTTPSGWSVHSTDYTFAQTTELYDSDSSEMNAYEGNATLSRRMLNVDSSYTPVVHLSSGQGFQPLGDISDYANGFGTRRSLAASAIQTFDDDLGLIATSSSTGHADVVAANANKIVTGDIDLMDVSSLTSDWTTSDTVKENLADIDSSNNVYYITSADKLRRLNNADGSEDWITSNTFSGNPSNFHFVTNLNIAGSSIIATGDFTWDSTLYNVASFALSDGSFEWGTTTRDGFEIRDFRYFNSSIYVCGERG